MPKVSTNKKLSKTTQFQGRVYSALLQIPKGQVTTYKLLAKYLSCGSAQAVGQALKRNPYAPGVPCHRVVKADGSLGGFHGKTSGTMIDKKRRLLESEGVTMSEDDVIDKKYWFDFEGCKEEEFVVPDVCK
jgi:methylated-DNA-[protein]-cysteine S-methyltransferase